MDKFLSTITKIITLVQTKVFVLKNPKIISNNKILKIDIYIQKKRKFIFTLNKSQFLF